MVLNFQLKNIFKRKKVKKEDKNQVEEINIVQEDETDYEKQWSKKVIAITSKNKKSSGLDQLR